MPEIKKLHCNYCKHDTNHELLASHDSNYYQEGEQDGHKYLEYYEKSKYGFWVCKGCDNATLEEKYTMSGMKDHKDNEIYSYIYSPERNNKSIRVAKKFAHIDKKLNSVYQEIIESYNKGLKIISAVGIRALLEGICVQEGIDDKVAYNLSKKIVELKNKNGIPESIIEGLNNLKFIGDDAAHRLSESNEETLLLSIELLEALLTNLYEAKFDLQIKAEKVTNAHKNI